MVILLSVICWSAHQTAGFPYPRCPEDSEYLLWVTSGPPATLFQQFEKKYFADKLCKYFMILVNDSDICLGLLALLWGCRSKEEEMVKWLSNGAPDLVTTTFVQRDYWARKFTFFLSSGKNFPSSKLMKTTRPIFICIKTDGNNFF